MKKVIDKKDIDFCSRHQVIHKTSKWKSCRFPNAKPLKRTGKGV